MADLADLIQKAAYYQAGGRDPGQYTLDKLDKGTSIVDKTITDVLAIKKAQLEGQKTKQETQKLALGNQPITETFGTPIVENQIAVAESVPIPLEDLKSGRLDTRQAGLDQAADTSRYMTNQFGNSTVDQYGDMAKADLAKAQAEYLRSGQKGGDKLWVNVNTREISDVPKPGFVKVSNNTGATIASGPSKEEALLGRQKEMERINVEPTTKLRYNDLRMSLRIADNLEKGLNWALANKVDITGIINYPIARFKEYIGKLPPDQQKVLTDLRTNFARFGRQMGGTAFTPTERQIFAPIMPEVTLPTETNLNRIVSAIEELNARIADEEETSPGLRELYAKPEDKAKKPKPPKAPSQLPGKTVGATKSGMKYEVIP